tara:strand:+ start:46 stop:297 length:252 start_codon:yes stop_codon:yes gene_type:complete
MAIIEQQIKMSEVMISDLKLEASNLGLGESRLINFPRVEEQKSGYYGDHQYPDNRKVFDGQNMIASESGLETINNSKTAGILG